MRKLTSSLALTACLLALAAIPARAQTAAPNTITVRFEQDAAGTGKNYTLFVEANQVTDLYGVGFDFRFDKKRLRWRKGTQRVGDLLSGTGTAETNLLMRQKPRGNIVIGASREGQVEGATGSGVLLTISFVNKKKSGDRALEMLNTKSFDSTGAELTEVTWQLEPFPEEQ